MLKFKQRDNEDFVFLLRDHPWHAYYLHLKDVEDKKLNQTGIGLLGTYSSSDEDDHDNEAVQEAVKYDEPVNTVRLIHPEQAKKVDNDQTGDNDNSDEAAQKARRLKRAKMMKGHYALKLMESSKNSQFWYLLLRRIVFSVCVYLAALPNFIELRKSLDKLDDQIFFLHYDHELFSHCKQ